MRKSFAGALVATAVLLASCGDSDDETPQAATTPTTGAAVTTTGGAAVTTTARPATTAAAAATTTAAAATGAVCADSAAPAAGATVVNVSLVEWKVEAPTTIKAGPLAFAVTNPADNKHEFVIIKADSFASLPKLSNGAVDESKLPAGSLLGSRPKLDGKSNCTTGVNLPAGKYVFLCNINVGPNSHAAKGQNLDVTVA